MTVKHKTLIMALMLVMAGFIVYSNSFENTAFLTNDDSILKNPLIQNYKNIPLLFSGAVLRYNESQYRPLNLVLLSLSGAFVKNDNVFFWRLLPVGLHVMNAVLLFLLIFICSGERLFSFMGALMFLAHPWASAFVNNLENIHYLLGIFFLLGGLIFTALFLKTGKMAYQAACLILYIGGLLSSDIVLAAILFAFLISFSWKESRFSARTFIMLLSLVLAGLAYYYLISGIKLVPLAIFMGQNRSLVSHLEGFRKNMFCPYLLLATCSFAVSLLCMANNLIKKPCKYVLPLILLLVTGYCAQRTFGLNARYLNNVTYWESVIEERKEDIENAAFHLAKSLYESGMPYEAQKYFLMVSSKGATKIRVKAFYYLMNIYLEENKYEKAFFHLMNMSTLADREIRQIDNELRYIPQEVPYDDEERPRLFSENELYTKLSFLGYAKYYFAIGLYDWAEFLFSELYLYNSYDMEYLYCLGQLFIRKGYYESAKKYFRRMLELNPYDALAAGRIEYIDGIVDGRAECEPAGDYPAKAYISKPFAKLLAKLSMGTLSKEKTDEVTRLLYMGANEN
jgi:hypothetical protein